jgi:macrolide transport system ATP-binding/permease protein
MSAMLELRQISHSYAVAGENLSILSGVDLSLAKGAMAAIQGPSGSGKSTLLYLIGCLQKVQRGQLLIDGVDVADLSEESLALFRNQKIGFIFQQFHLLPKATVLENILLPSQYPSETASVGPAQREKARELAALVGLGDRLDHRPNQLSGGQQQRVAIARALMNDPALILADEPTGNLDSKSSAQIMDLLRSLNTQGRTILLITHDGEVAAKCKTIHHILDGKFTEAPRLPPPAAPSAWRAPSLRLSPRRAWKIARSQLPMAWSNLGRNKVRTLLTMLGITIGIAAVLSMVTLGQFTKDKILASYAELGVNTVAFYGYRNWQQKATDIVPGVFNSFDWRGDLAPLPRIFPEIARVSPLMMTWQGNARFGGKIVENEVRVMGVSEEAMSITNREVLRGRNFTKYQVEKNSAVCLVGHEIAEKLLKSTTGLGQVLLVDMNDSTFSCQIIGVLAPTSSNKEWAKPNLQVIVPYTFFQKVVKEPWYKEINNVLIQLKPQADVEKIGKSIQAFFELKYGKSGHFRVDSDSVLLAQMKRFLTLFTLLLTFIALVSLAVGGIGITNMMLVSVSERFREIGLRKALGATPASIRLQFLLEALLTCGIGGLLGLIFGMAGYHAILFGASKLVSKLEFTFLVDWMAVALSLSAILLVGVLSGLFPALKAERLQVIEALRSE